MTLDRHAVATRLARDIPDGSYVNLGIGVPTLVADYLPPDRQIILHTENGMLGMGRAAEPAEVDADLINAGKIYVTEEPGASYFHHADSFAMMRGGHLDYCVIGAYQVSIDGDLANWRTNSVDSIPGVGGAMDLVAGARHVYVLMDLFTRSGESKLVERCDYPLTGSRCVTRVYSDYAIFEFGGPDVTVLELFSDGSVDDLARLIGIPLVDARA